MSICNFKWVIKVVCSIPLLVLFSNSMATDANLSPIEELGKRVFFDKISEPARQACVSCHAPRVGGVVPISGIHEGQVVMTGADPHTFGKRKPPTNAYASFSRPFTPNRGGNFWDGRATGAAISADIIPAGKEEYLEYLGPTADQALGPFTNEVEQNNLNREAVCSHIQESKYAPLFEIVWGSPIDCGAGIDTSFKRIAVSIAAWQASSDLNSFSSKVDFAIAAAPKDEFGQFNFPLELLSPEENEGHDLFNGSCAAFCHNSGSVRANRVDVNDRYTLNSYFNIGVPVNPENPQYTLNPDFKDLGLFEHTASEGDQGKFRVPTIRNVDKRPALDFVKSYSHNGWFKSLENIVHFYNTRDVKPRCVSSRITIADALLQDCWPAPEITATVTRARGIGNLGWNSEQEAAVVAYMRALTDTHTAKKPHPYK